MASPTPAPSTTHRSTRHDPQDHPHRHPAIAIAALAAPTALARPADMPPAVAEATQREQEQDVRSPDAIDAATQQNRQDLRAPDHEYPTRPAQGEQANPRPETPPQAPADPSVAWR